MPRRDEKIKANQTYWIRKPDGKGYPVFSTRQLNKLITDGTIGQDDLVQVRRVAEGSY